MLILFYPKFRSDLREMEWRLDKEGREYHHFDEFRQMYKAEIKNLNRILESLVRTGVVPTPGYQLLGIQQASFETFSICQNY